ncbi:MAG: ABC transporter permease [Chroococcidiopsidaceae cyanobacterium CP_BM_ER_R8_30]|nr:ABC transporter permease [Chroococcidiopsidaceae cyanobacterium CP_BM_ER_R8_30]
MDIFESVKMAISTLAANRLRSSLTMLGIVIGNASVIALVGVGQGVQNMANRQFGSLGTNVLFVVPGSRNATEKPKTLVLKDAEAIATQVPSVKAVAPEIDRRELVTYRDKRTYTSVIGATPPYPSVRDFDVAQGRFLTDLDLKRNAEVIVIGSDLDQRLFGDRNPIGQQVWLNNLSFQVIGVMASKGSSLGTNQDDAAYIPITTMSNRIVGWTSPYGTEVTYISVSAKNKASIDSAQFQITNLLRLRHRIIGEDDFTVDSQKSMLAVVDAITVGLTLLLAAIAGISLLVGGIGIMNIMLVSVSERTHEIGLRKAIGATQQDILIQFIIEAVILSSLGGLLGTIFGAGGILLIGAVTPLQAAVAPLVIVVAVSVSGGIGLFFGVVPARRAAQLDPIVALRSA